MQIIQDAGKTDEIGYERGTMSAQNLKLISLFLIDRMEEESDFTVSDGPVCLLGHPLPSTSRLGS